MEEIIGIKVYPDGNEWCVLYGKDIQKGICGFGQTIWQALFNFAEDWRIKRND